MPILDEDGRLFGRINILDLAAGIGIVLLGGLFFLGYRLYASSYRELVRMELRDETKFLPAQGFDTAKPVGIALILYARIPDYLRNAISVGDAEVRSDEAELPMKILAMQPADGKTGAYFLLLGGKAAKAASGVLLAGFYRRVRLGETFSFSARDYKLSGTIVRVFPEGIAVDEFPRTVREIGAVD